MKEFKKVKFPTKILSNSYYLNEVPVEGKATSKFNFYIGWYDLYAAQIIRTGNCITLLSNPYTLTVDSFWNVNHLEDIVKYIFWTFNDSFRHKLVEQIPVLSPSALHKSLDLLKQYTYPYDDSKFQDPDEELKWCFVKNESLKKSGQFENMYRRDQENREAIKSALERAAESYLPTLAIEATVPLPVSPNLLEMLMPLNGSALETLQFIRNKLHDAEFRFDIFIPVRKSKDNRNPHGFNGCVAAMIDFFYQRNYFLQSYSLEEILNAYFHYSGNSIAKLSSFLSEFRQDNSFIKHTEKLNKLNINKLK